MKVGDFDIKGSASPIFEIEHSLQQSILTWSKTITLPNISSASFENNIKMIFRLIVTVEAGTWLVIAALLKGLGLFKSLLYIPLY